MYFCKKSTMNNKLEKKYIDKALNVLKVEGLQLSMTQISEKIGVTKKTLYNHFLSKENLVSLCIETLINKLFDDINDILAKNYKVDYELKRIFEIIIEYTNSVSIDFIKDIKKLYPILIDFSHQSARSVILEIVTRNLKKGIKEDIYFKNLNVEIISHFLVYSTLNFLYGKVIKWHDYSRKKYFNEVIEYHLRGIRK